MHHLSALKFGTQIVGVTAHLGTKFGWNTVNTRKVMCNFSRKIIPICCHPHRVDRAWDWYRSGLTINPQTFCDLKEVKLNIMRI